MGVYISAKYILKQIRNYIKSHTKASITDMHLYNHIYQIIILVIVGIFSLKPSRYMTARCLYQLTTYASFMSARYMTARCLYQLTTYASFMSARYMTARCLYQLTTYASLMSARMTARCLCLQSLYQLGAFVS